MIYSCDSVLRCVPSQFLTYNLGDPEIQFGVTILKTMPFDAIKLTPVTSVASYDGRFNEIALPDFVNFDS